MAAKKEKNRAKDVFTFPLNKRRIEPMPITDMAQ